MPTLEKLMMRETHAFPAIAAVVLILLVTVPISGNSLSQSKNLAPQGGLKYPGFAPDSAMPPQVTKFGDPLDLAGSPLTLDQFGAAMANSPAPLMRWSDRLAAFGVGADGYYWIWVFPSRAALLTPSWESSVISVLNSAARSMGCSGDIPVKFAIASG